eukprot:SAG31_NODE_6383_length_2037_cov_27.616615_2_plen_103_part_00
MFSQIAVCKLSPLIWSGPDLEVKGLQVGVVTAIVGIDGCEIYFAGQANHAGTTPMNLRKDAGMAAIVLAGRINDAFSKGSILGPSGVWTVRCRTTLRILAYF